jgi:hypothetical protein
MPDEPLSHNFWAPVVEVVMMFPAALFAGAPQWTAAALADVHDRWVSERLDGRAELERILEQTTSEARVEELLHESLRRLLLASGTGRVLSRISVLLQLDERFVRDEHGWRLVGASETGPSQRSVRELVRGLDDRSDEQLGIQTFDGYVLVSSPIPDDSHLTALVGHVLTLAEGSLDEASIREVVVRRAGLALGAAPVKRTALPVDVDEAAASVRRRLAPRLAESLREDSTDEEALAVIAAFSAEVSSTTHEAQRIGALAQQQIIEGAAPSAAAPLVIPSGEGPLEIARRWRHDATAAPRRGDLWSVAPSPDGTMDGLRLLLLDDGHAEGLETWFNAAYVDDDVDRATSADLLLASEDTTLAAPLRVAIDRVLAVRPADLDVRFAQATRSGALTLDLMNAGRLASERFGPALRYARVRPVEAPEHRAALEQLARRTSEAHASEPDEDAELLVIGELDGLWPRRVSVHPGVLAVVDLLAGDAAPATIIDASHAHAEDVAAALREDPRCAAAVRRLVAAEVRHADRPFGPWALDSAAAAADLRLALDEAYRDNPVLTTLLERRVEQALAVLPSGDLLQRVLAHADEDFRAAFLGALAGLSETLEGSPLGDRYEDWRDAVSAGSLRRSDLVARFEPLVPAGTWGDDRARRLQLDPATHASAIAEAGRRLEVDTDPDDPSRVRLRIVIRGDVARALLREPPDDALLGALAPGVDIRKGLWVTMFDAGTGAAEGHCMLVFDGQGALTGSAPKPSASAGYVVGPYPTRWVGSEPLLSTALRVLPEARPAAAQYLMEVGARFGDDWRQQSLLGLATALEASDRASGPQLPTGVLTSPISLLLPLMGIERALVADRVVGDRFRSVGGGAAAQRRVNDLRQLDDGLS